MSLFLKRDEEGTRAPSPDQLGVGELVVVLPVNYIQKLLLEIL